MNNKIYEELIKLAEDGTDLKEDEFEPKLKEILGITGTEEPGQANQIVYEIDGLVDTLARFLIELRLGTANVYSDKQVLAQIIKTLSNIRWQLAMQE